MHRQAAAIAISFVIAGIACAPPAVAAVYRVGVGAGCTQASIQAAIGAAAMTVADDEIHLSATLAYSQQALLVDSVQGTLVLAGGYASCADAVPVAGAHTLIDGNGTLSVLRIHAKRTF
jgi:hypothetical protein